MARQRLSPAHYGYLATGTDNDATVRANRTGFDRFQLRARRLTGIREIDLSCELPSVPPLDWDFVDRLRDSTDMKLLIKGIVSQEDASLCLSHGVDGLIVSNHGGRAENSGRSTIECLPEVVEAAGGRMPVLIDSGFRRGTDIFKALAPGADAVCIGRPYIWGLAAFGQDGVETVLDILNRELALVMRQCGTAALEQIGTDTLV